MVDNGGASVAGTILGSVASLVDSGLDAWMTYETNKQNENLMRESWSREDNAVLRRVLDLKAAGLSPTLAAGSAAASSGPITLKHPKSGLSAAVNNALTVASAVKTLKTQDLQNENLKKQGENLDLANRYYGLPDWYVAGERAFGAEAFGDKLREIGPKIYDLLFGDGGTESLVSSTPAPSTPVEEAKDAIKEASRSESSETVNQAVKKGFEKSGIDTEPRSSLFDPSTYGRDLNDACQTFVKQMIRDDKVNFDILSRLADSLSHIYNVSKDEVQNLLGHYLTEAGL